MLSQNVLIQLARREDYWLKSLCWVKPTPDFHSRFSKGNGKRPCFILPKNFEEP